VSVLLLFIWKNIFATTYHQNSRHDLGRVKFSRGIFIHKVERTFARDAEHARVRERADSDGGRKRHGDGRDRLDVTTVEHDYDRKSVICGDGKKHTHTNKKGGEISNL